MEKRIDDFREDKGIKYREFLEVFVCRFGRKRENFRGSEN